MIDVLHTNHFAPIILPLINLIFLITQAVLISMLLQGNKITTRPTLIPASVFILLCSFFPDMLYNTPAILCGFFLIWILFKIFSAYNKPKADMIYFDTGLLNAISSILYFPSLIFSIYSLLALIRMRSITLRECVLFLSGFFVIYFLSLTALFWFDLLPEFWQSQFNFNLSQEHILQFFSAIVVVKCCLIGGVLIVALIFYSNRFSTNLIQVRKYLGSFISFFLFGLTAIFLQKQTQSAGLYSALIGCSIFISYYFFHSKNRTPPEIMHFALLGFTFLFQYINFTA